LIGPHRDAQGYRIFIVRHREFMAGFTGYDDYSLLGRVPVAAGVHETPAFDCRDGKREIIYRDVYIPRKEKRK
jgi:hypothetical protein